jgi:hypothetical protein
MSGDLMFCVCMVVNGDPERVIGEWETCVEVMIDMLGMSPEEATGKFVDIALGFPLIVTEPYDLFIEIVPYDAKYLRPVRYREYDPTQQGDTEDDI